MVNESKIIKKIKQCNDGYRIKLRTRKNPNSSYRLYLDYWDGSKRHTENLKIYISGTNKAYAEDNKNFRIALAIRNKKETELLEDRSGLSLTSNKGSSNFLDFFVSYASTKPDTNYRIAMDHFRNYLNKDFIEIKNIDYQISVGYSDLLPRPHVMC